MFNLLQIITKTHNIEMTRNALFVFSNV